MVYSSCLPQSLFRIESVFVPSCVVGSSIQITNAYYCVMIWRERFSFSYKIVFIRREIFRPGTISKCKQSIKTKEA